MAETAMMGADEILHIVTNSFQVQNSRLSEMENKIALFEEKISLRDQFAMSALTGMLASGKDFFPDEGDEWEDPSKDLFKIADAMLAGRQKERE